MGVYSVKAQGMFGGGMAIVVADSHEDARGIADQKIRYDHWRCRWLEGEVEELALKDEHGLSRVVDYYCTGE